MSDEQVRQMLIDELRKEQRSAASPTVKEHEAGGVGALFAILLNNLDSGSADFEQQLQALSPWVSRIPGDLQSIFISLGPHGTVQSAVKNVLWILLLITSGLILEQTAKRRVLSLYFRVDTDNFEALNPLSRFTASAANELPDIIGLCLFFGVSYATFLLVEVTESPAAQVTFLAVLLTLTLIRLVSILSKILLSPSQEEFRSLSLASEGAGKIHWLMVFAIGYIISVMMFSVLLERLGADRKTILLLLVFLPHSCFLVPPSL